jgi:hypothetical protein
MAKYEYEHDKLMRAQLNEKYLASIFLDATLGSKYIKVSPRVALNFSNLETLKTACDLVDTNTKTIAAGSQKDEADDLFI